MKAFPVLWSFRRSDVLIFQSSSFADNQLHNFRHNFFGGFSYFQCRTNTGWTTISARAFFHEALRGGKQIGMFAIEQFGKSYATRIGIEDKDGRIELVDSRPG